jgi:hypothetical protein
MFSLDDEDPRTADGDGVRRWRITPIRPAPAWVSWAI